ncbi:molybdenum cofactor guanylyltransferase MobA [Ideonella sp. BN130291]|uniref:molybdenum cofactor guanylyltransferase MobA n=1 Tax=Ideonella sp. BN130291 TaxID=3112940 RepID=UPI002E25751F|nr:molybdenum cofactor guanylyltransferase MobA [Ideonella sp. BN130291]
MLAIPREAITGLVLAGGRGQRMQGQDKGLLLHRGRPLVQHALDRLAPQVGPMLISANRHLPAYRSFGTPVCSDTMPGFPGPLAGWLSALQACRTPYLASVPCDVPGLPLDLVARLARALHQADADIAMARTPEREQPVFALLRHELAPSLEQALARGERRVLGWALEQRMAVVAFADAAAFRNLNTPADLDPSPADTNG